MVVLFTGPIPVFAGFKQSKKQQQKNPKQNVFRRFALSTD